MLDQAARLFQSGQLDQAREKCADALSSASDSTRRQALNLLSIIDLQKGDFKSAESTLAKLLELTPADDAAHYHLGLALQSQDQWSEASLSYEQAWKLRPDQQHYQVNFIESLIQSQRWSRAAEVTEACRRHGMNTTEWAEFSIRVLCGQRAWTQVLKLLDATTGSQQMTEANRICLMAARQLIGANRPEDALKALEYCPDICASFDAMVCRSVARDRLDQSSAAIEDARTALAMKPDDFLANFNLAALLSKRFDSESLNEAERHVNIALSMNPSSAEAWYTASVISGKRLDFERAMRTINKALELNPKYEDALIQSADILDRTDRIDDCVMLLNDAVNVLPDSSALWRQLGIGLIKQTSFDQACDALRTACDLDGTDQRSIAHYILALAANGHVEKAESLQNFADNVKVVTLPVPPGHQSSVEFNLQLEADIRAHSTLRFEPIGLAARNGYLTEELRTDQTSAIDAFEQALMIAITDYIEQRQQDPTDPFLANRPSGDVSINLWATLVKGGGQIDTHIHEDSWLSGAYYVKTGQRQQATAESDQADSTAGYLELGRPHAGLPVSADQPIHLIRPVEGTLVLFPSFMFHRTIPDSSDAERISIAFDLKEKTETGQ